MLAGDAAKKLIEEDEFGLLPIVQSIKDVLRSRVAADGYALGIEGRWGSGKTTLLNFVDQALKADADGYQKVIRFEPWLIGDKRTLLRTFFGELARTIEEFRNDARVSTKIGNKARPVLDRLVVLIDQYANYVDAASYVANSAAALDPSLYTKGVGALLKSIAWVGKLFKKKPPSLEELKEKITADLQVLKNLLPGVSITVLIDDTDRLDPDESVEILRLIKAVANFPVIVYLVCFDITILSRQVRRVIRVGNGEDYLEKIFQQIISLPPQEPFALRRFVRRRLQVAFPETGNSSPDDLDIRERQDAVYDQWLGKLIETPRDAIRLCESVKFGWPYLQGKGDFLDYVWLQLIKLKNRDLYLWTQNYVTGLGSYRDGGRPGDTGREEAEKLSAILNSLGWGSANYRSRISLILPGVKFVHLEGDKRQVFQFDPASELDNFESNRRLGSPSHWRYYFAFDKPSYALDDAELAEFRLIASQDREAAADMLRALAQKPHATPNYFLEVLLDRLKDDKDRTTPMQQVGMAWAFASMMDELPRNGEVHFRSADPWRQALKLLGPPVSSYISDIVARGASINWLALLLRDQGYVLRQEGLRAEDKERGWLSNSQWNEATVILVRRFRELGLSNILKLPEPLEVFFCWHDFDAAEVREVVAEAITTDNLMFMKMLLGMRGWMSSSADGLMRVLHAETVEMFMDPVVARARLEQLAESFEDGADVQVAARELLEVWAPKKGTRLRRRVNIPR